MTRFLAIVFVVLGLGASADATESDTGREEALAKYLVDPSSSLDSRIGEAPEEVIKMFTEAGEKAPPDHLLTNEERARFNAAVDKLAPLHRKFLQERVRTIAFLEGMPNNALTSSVNPDEPYQLFDITIRAGALYETVSELVTNKEQSVFDASASSLSVRIVAGDLDALVYVLLHEATHVVDHTLKISGAYDRPPTTAFVMKVWSDRTTHAPQYQDRLLDGIVWRRGGKVLPITDATQVYAALEKTPFASLYGSTNWFDDLAELVTWHYLVDVLGQPYRLEIRDGAKPIFTYEPMRSERVRERLTLIEMFDGPG